MNKRLITLLLTLTILIGAVGVVPTFAQDDCDFVGEIYVGVIAPLTGDIPKVGQSTVEAAEMAVEEVNAAFAVVAVPQILSVPDDSCRVHPFRGMAVEQRAGLGVNLVEGVAPVVGDLEVVALEAQVPRLIVGRVELVQDGSGSVHLVHVSRVGVVA